MPPENGRLTRDALWTDFGPPFAQSCERFLHVNHIPVHDGIESQAERARLLFLPLLQGVSDFVSISMVDLSCELVAKLLPVELHENTASKSSVNALCQTWEFPIEEESGYEHCIQI